MKTIPHSPLSSIPTMRKLAMGAWAHPKDPTVNVQLDIDITKTHEFLSNKPDIKLNALVIKIISSILNDYPDLNTTIIRKKLRQRQNNRIFIPTVFRYKKSIDLTGISIDEAHSKSLLTIQNELSTKVSDIRTFQNKQIKRAVKLFRYLPSRLTTPVIKIIDFLQYSLNISPASFGLPSDPFGSLTITFLDKFDIKYANIPLYPFSRSPITICIGAQYTQNNQRYLPMVCTFDHRYFDGYQGHRAVKRLKYYFNHPEVL